MIIRIAILLLIMLNTFFDAHAQDADKFSFEFKNNTLKKAILKVEDASSRTFYFDEDWIEGYYVTKSFKEQPLWSILNGIFENTNINYLIQDKKVILINNAFIYTELPKNLFEDQVEKPVDRQEKTAPIFQEEYAAQANFTKRKMVTIGKQRPNSANDTYILSGNFTSSSTGEPLQNLAISTLDGAKYAITDSKGDFRLRLPFGLNKLETNLLGYEKIKQDVIMYGNGNMNFSLTENTESLQEVVVKSKKDANVLDAAVGVTAIDIQSIKTIPLILGERDLLKVATTLPGIKTAGEGASGFNVRGGRVDQNLILLDNAVLYNPSHFLGFFSAVNPFTTGSMEIYKASIPAEYGGRLSSVFDIETRSGNMEKFAGEGSVGPVTANLAVELPVIKEKASLIAGFRGTYSGWILRSLDEEELKNSEASFYDGLIKYRHNIDIKNTIQGTVYFSKDRFSITSDSIFDYQNRLISLNFGHTFNESNKGELILVNSQYKYGINYEARANQDFDFGYEINEYQAKLNFNYNLNKRHKFTYGLSSKLYSVDPGHIVPLGPDSDILEKSIDGERGLESAIYISDKFEVSKRLLLDLGLRYSIYAAMGPATQNV